MKRADRSASLSPPQSVPGAPELPPVDFYDFFGFGIPKASSQLPEVTLGDLLITPGRLTVKDGTPIARGDRSNIFFGKLKESSGRSTNVVVKQLLRVDGEFSERYDLHRASVSSPGTLSHLYVLKELVLHVDYQST
ncbi:hypothetical protein FS837_001644 [Tulasnella sp. UAMH 9824]|nr:hypothetical protein FS837_001644 [Tulasnella sp. UAMH 9824]